jgi:glyoxylase I family protein
MFLYPDVGVRPLLTGVTRPTPARIPRLGLVERVTGIGGFFFRSRDPEALQHWYEEVLGVIAVPRSYDQSCWVQQEGETVFAPLDPDSPMPGEGREWSINFRVADLGAMVEQVRAAGSEVEVDPTEYPNGWFAQTQDPEGNRVQLWQPK